MNALSPRTKKLMATLALLVWLPLYALAAMRVGVAVLPEAGPFLTLIYYALAGTGLVVAPGLMLAWVNPGPNRRLGGTGLVEKQSVQTDPVFPLIGFPYTDA